MANFEINKPENERKNVLPGSIAKGLGAGALAGGARQFIDSVNLKRYYDQQKKDVELARMDGQMEREKIQSRNERLGRNRKPDYTRARKVYNNSTYLNNTKFGLDPKKTRKQNLKDHFYKNKFTANQFISKRALRNAGIVGAGVLGASALLGYGNQMRKN